MNLITIVRGTLWQNLKLLGLITVYAPVSINTTKLNFRKMITVLKLLKLKNFLTYKMIELLLSVIFEYSET